MKNKTQITRLVRYQDDDGEVREVMVQGDLLRMVSGPKLVNAKVWYQDETAPKGWRQAESDSSLVHEAVISLFDDLFLEASWLDSLRGD